MLGMKIVSVNSKHYRPLPRGKPWGKSSKFGQSWPLVQIFLSNAQHLDFPESLYFNKFYAFQPLSRSQSLEYLQIHMDNIYLSIGNMSKSYGGLMVML